MTSAFHWINFILAIIAIIIAIIAIIVFVNRERDITELIPIITIFGTTTETKDELNTDRNTVYIGQSSSNMELIINPTTEGTSGYIIYVKNNSDKIITLAEGLGVSIDPGKLNLIVCRSKTAQLYALSPNTFIRLQ